MKVLTVGTSPLQMQNAIQYITQHGVAFSSCVLAHIGSSREDDTARALAIAADHGWAAIEKFPPYVAFKPDEFETREHWAEAEIANRQAFVDLAEDFFARVGTEFDIVLMGDYRPMSFRQFLQFIADPQPEVVLLDDGAVSRYVMEFRDTGAADEEVTRGILPNLGENDPFRVMESASLTYFTIYDETIAQSDRIVANTRYQNTSSDAFTTLGGEVWICGVNHVEARLAKQDELMAMCRKVRTWFPDAKIVYFPHRRESPEKVELVCRMIGATASDYRFGLEEYVFQNRCKPEHLVVFGSTVADTLSRLFAPETRILVVVPEEKYFTKAKRADHVRSVVVDNIRKNGFVRAVGTEAANVRAWVSATGIAPVADGAAAPIAASASDAPPVVGLERLTSSPGDDGWTRVTEMSGHGLHRATLGSFPASAKGEAHLHLFRLRAEERYAFRIRFAQADKPGNFVQLTVVADVAASYREDAAFGLLAVEVTVDRRREARIAVFAKSHSKVSSKLQLITLNGADSGSSFHASESSSGFSIAPFDPAASRVCSAPPSDVGHVAQIAAPPRGVALFPVHLGDTTTILCVHNGFLHGFGADRLVSKQFAKLQVRCIDGTVNKTPVTPHKPAAPRFAADRPPGDLRDRLHRTVSIHLSRRGRKDVIAASPSGDRIRLGRAGPIGLGLSDLRTGTMVVLDVRETDLQRLDGFSMLF